MAWVFYILGIIMFQAPVGHEWALLVFALGMLLHWKFWIITIVTGTIAFLVGAGWSKPSL